MNEAAPKGRPGESAPETVPSSASSPIAGAASEGPPMDIQAYIGSGLRQVFADVARQPIPDRFLDLMRQLDKSEKG